MTVHSRGEKCRHHMRGSIEKLVQFSPGPHPEEEFSGVIARRCLGQRGAEVLTTALSVVPWEMQAKGQQLGLGDVGMDKAVREEGRRHGSHVHQSEGAIWQQ